MEEDIDLKLSAKSKDDKQTNTKITGFEKIKVEFTKMTGLVDGEHIPTVSSLQQEIQAKNIELQNKEHEIQAKSLQLHNKDAELAKIMSTLQAEHPNLPPKQVNKSSTDFWNNLRITWQKCADLPSKVWAKSVAELDGKVYVTVFNSRGGYNAPYMYDSNKDHWSILPELPSWYFSLVTVPDRKQLLAIGGIVRSNNVVKVTNKVFLWDEENGMWLTPYPDMPTARFKSSCISHRSSVIVVGGISRRYHRTMARSVEVLHITDTDSHWSVVEQLPHGTRGAVPLIVNDNLYITVGCDKDNLHTCDVVTASLPQLLQSSKNTNSGQVWNKLPDMPYVSQSINHYQGRLITFTGGEKVEQPGKHVPTFKLVPLIHIYNVNAKCWDCVGEIPHGYYFGRSVLLKENKILFLGGLTGRHNPNNDDDIITTCMLLTLTPHLALIDNHY
ncbi:uncharacterized protein [Dysidea avara]|uniref:uncharacterized protein isoform X2 n=1 Tax=Dysidea avara TaxID=196820 RepID=UPI00331BCFF6